MELPGLTVLDELHDGSRTVILRCRRDDGSTVIAKVLKSSPATPDEVAQLRHEHDLASALDPEAVVRPLSLEHRGGRWFLLLEDHGAKALSRWVREGGLELDVFFPLAVKLVRSLEAVHRGHVIHKDLKPANVVVSDDLAVRLTDFGVASRLGREAPPAVATRLEGTLAYVSPEQTGRMNRVVDSRTDHYSLGVTLFELLTGRRPFAGDDPVALIHAHLARPAPSPRSLRPELPEGLAPVVAKLLAKTAEERYQSLHALVDDLEHCWREWRDRGDVVPFEIAARDVSDRLSVSQKLYGREVETSTLLAALDRVAVGAAEVVCISGRAGIGKSSLVREISRPITARRGYFIAGKFDQLQRSSPHAALIETLADLVHQVLTESDSEVELWRRQLSEVLGPNGAVLSSVIPAVELILGPQPEVPELGPVEAQNRFNLVLHEFIGVFARPESPLVIFLDDAQWADPGSLHLLELMMTDRYRQHLLLILAHRDEDVTVGDPLPSTLAAIERSGTPITRVGLSPLSREHTGELVADTVGRPVAEVEPLAALVYAKAGGNPFFMGELLTVLHGDGLIAFDDRRRRWRWDIERIREHVVTDNVVDLLAKRLRRLPAATQEALALAACVGARFDASTLVVAAGRRPRELVDDLWPAVTAGLVLPLGRAHDLAGLVMEDGGQDRTVEFRFAHDRIQQAVYELLEPEDRCRIHRRIGEELWGRLDDDPSRDPRVFDVVTQLNLARDLAVSGDERERLAGLNLAAGIQALRTTAYEQAARFLDSGLELLDRDAWERSYELALQLHVRAAEASFLVRAEDRLEHCTGQVLEHARTVLDAVPAYEAIIQNKVARDELGDAIEVALQLFGRLGVRLPRRPTLGAILRALIATRLTLMGQRVEDLGELQAMSDRHKRAALRTLMRVATAVYVSAPDWMPLLVFKGVQLTVRHGLVAESAFALSAYGIVLCGVLGRIDEGYRFGQLGLRLLERFDSRELEPRVKLVTSMLIRHWREPVRDTAPAMLEGYRAGLETGDLEFAAHCIRGYCFTLFAAGTTLAELDGEMRRASQVITKLGQAPLLLVQGAWHQTVANLRGESVDPSRLEGEHFSARELVPRLERTNNRLALCDFHLTSMMLLFLFGKAEEALTHARRGREVIDGITSAASVPIFHFWEALTIAGVLTQGGGRPRLRLALARNLRRLRRWAAHAPANQEHRALLVSAELHRLRGRHERAAELYERALDLAREGGYVHEAAVAAELASRFHRTRGRRRVADLYWWEARELFRSWGADAKLASMDREIEPGTVSPREAVRSVTSSTSASATTADGVSSFDLAAVIRASQVISGELELGGLITTVLGIVLANAGADRATLILNRDGRLVVVALATGGGESITSGLERTIESSDDLPLSVVQYVARTRTSVVLGDSSEDGLFAGDPYLQRHPGRSVLCTPLVHRGRLIGLLVLENTLTSGAFTANRVEVVGLLGTQAAIAIANAQALQTRAEQERLRLEAEFLAARNQELARLNADKDRFFSIISHDLRSPFNPLMGFAEILAAGGDTLPPERVKRLADRVYSSARNVYNLLENLLEWTRIQTGRMDFEPTRLELAPVVADTLALLEANAEAKGIGLRGEVPVEAVAEADRAMVSTVIRNLVSNAVKFCERDGEVSVRVEVGPEEVEVRVADTGVGMAPEVVTNLFRLDSRHTTPGTAAETGTGLGLILCRELVERNRGRIWAESEAGVGSTFHFTLPRG